MTITNISSSKAKITFSYSATGDVKSFSESAKSGLKELTLEANGTYEMTISNKSAAFSTTTATLTLGSFTYSAIGEATNATMNYSDSLGSVTAGGTAVSNGGDFEIPSVGVAMVATPKSGAEFVGWINVADNTMLSTDASFTLLPISGLSTVQAVFETKDTGTAWFLAGGDKLYSDFATAASYAAAKDNKTVILLNSGTMATGTHNVPSGVSFLIPYSKSDYNIHTSTATDESGSFASTLEYANATFVTQDSEGPNGGTVTGVMEPQTSITYTLTIPSGTVLNVNSGGKLVIGGTLVGGTNSTTGICSATAGAHSNIQLDGTINVQGGGILSVSGYILGDGTVNAASSATVYQPFVLMDHKDGHYAYAAKEEDYFPYNRHALLNIQSKLVLNTGSDMYGYVAMFTKKNSFASAQFNVACARIVGSGDEEAVFLLGSGSRLEMRYDADKSLNVTSSTTNINRGYYSKVGRTTMTFIGDAALGYLTLTVKAAGTDSDLTTANSAFPIPYNYNVIQQTGSFSVNNHMSLLPGATFTVNDGAGMTISSGKNLVVYDGLRDYAQRSESVTLDGDDETGGTWPTYHYPSSANLTSYGFSSTAELIMNGMLTVYGNLGGTIQTNGTTGKIVMDSDAGTSATAQFGVQKSTVNLVVMKIDGSSGKTTRTLNAQVFTGENSEPLALEKGKTYVATGTGTNTLSSYTYGVYASHDASAATSEAKTDLNATITGTWCIEGHAYKSAETKPTCTEQGYTIHTCTICGDRYLDDYVNATGHTDTDADLACDTCGVPMARLAAIEASADAEVLLKLKFLINSDLINDGHAVVTKQDENGKAVGTSDTYYFKDMVPDSGGRYIFSMGIASGEMTRPVTVQIFDGDGNLVSITDYADGNVYTTVSRTVVDYAKLALEKGTDGQKKIVTYMLTYGGYAQKYFGVDTDNPAYNVLTEFRIDPPTLPDSIGWEVERSDTSSGPSSTPRSTCMSTSCWMRAQISVTIRSL